MSGAIIIILLAVVFGVGRKTEGYVRKRKYMQRNSRAVINSVKFELRHLAGIVGIIVIILLILSK